MAAGL